MRKESTTVERLADWKAAYSVGHLAEWMVVLKALHLVACLAELWADQ